MSTALDILRSLMNRVRREMFQGKPDKTWYAQQALVKKALTYPAHWLHERYIPFTGGRYRQIVDGIITTMVQKGDLQNIQFLSRYILHCVQEHMRHHDDTYYNEGKAAALDVVLRRLERPKPADPTVAILAQTHAALQIGKRKPKATPATPEPDLFAAAKPQRKSKVTL